MPDTNLLIQGGGLIVFLAAFYTLSFFAYLKRRVYLALFFIAVAGFGLRFFCSLDPMLHPWDERYHALVAKNIIEQPLEPKLYKEHVVDYDYTNWSANKIWLHKQPAPLWVIALSLKVFGISELSVRLPSVLLSTLSIFLTFCIGLFLFRIDRIALIAAFLQSINGLIIDLASGRVATDHIDTFFLFFVELSIFFILLNNRNDKRVFLILAGVACGLAILTKWLPALIIFPLYLIMNLKSKFKRRLLVDFFLLGIVTLLIALPWQIYAQSVFPLEYYWEQHFNKLHFTEGLEGHAQPWWYFINQIRISVNEMIYIVLLWFSYYLYRNTCFLRQNLFLLIYITIPFLVFSIAKTKMPGYILFTFPAYFIIIGLFIDHLLFGRGGGIYKSGFNQFSVLVTAFIFFLALRYGIERVKPFKSNNKEWLAKKELLSINFPKKTVLFNTPCPIEWMFYTNCLAYSLIPDSDLIEQLHEKKYNLFIIDDGNLPGEIKKEDRIEKIKVEKIQCVNR